jgi:SulP family sulfate permease
MVVAGTIAFLAGVLQLGLGALRMGVLTDYISTPVVTGYITGAAVLIAVGQLGNATAAGDLHGSLLRVVSSVPGAIGDARADAVALAVASVVTIAGLRRVHRAIPGSLLALAAGGAAAWWLDDPSLPTVGDLAPIRGGLPPLTLPHLDLTPALLPAAVAAMMLSLVESNAVGRMLAAKSGIRLDANFDFVGQGAANLASALGGGYPVSGSLNRSVLNWAAGARSRVAGITSGLLVLVVTSLFGPLVGRVPVASLAGLLFVVAWDLVDVSKIRGLFRAGRGDLAAFLVTFAGTLVLHLEQAIYLGVGVSILLYLRRARLLVVTELVVDERLHLREAEPQSRMARCSRIRVLHVEGRLFFATATELSQALEHAFEDRKVEVFVLRLKRTTGLDATVAEVLARAALELDAEGRHLLLVGMRGDTMARLREMGLEETVGVADLFPSRPGWFEAMDLALARALELAGQHEEGCPIEAYLAERRSKSHVS